MKAKNQFANTFWKMLTIFSTIIFTFTVIIIFTQVIARYLIKVPMPWTEELSRFLYIWSIFIGSAVASREGLHMDLEFIEFKKPIVGLIALILRHFFILFFSLVVIIGAFVMIRNNYGIFASTIPMSYSYVYLPLFLGFIMIFFIEIKDIFVKYSHRKGL